MKPLHVGLLLVGAGIAGGIAFQMTQLQPISVPAPPPPVASLPPSVNVPPAVNSVPRVDVPFRKPSPIPQGPTRAAAPDTVYTEPSRNEPAKPAARKSQPAAPPGKNEATSVASVAHPSLKPRQWIPGKYDSFGGATAAPKTATKPAPALVATASVDRTTPAPVLPAIEKDSVPATQVPASQTPAPRQATLRTGMTIAIRLNEPLSIDYSRSGGSFAGALADPVIADGFVIAERGARVFGRVIESDRAGRSTGSSRLELGLTKLLTSDGQEVAISTEPWLRLGDGIPAETLIRFRLTSKVTITERQLAAK